MYLERFRYALAGIHSLRLAVVVRGAVLIPVWLILSVGNAGQGLAAEAVADVHLHYNWDQEELISPEAVLSVLKQHNVVLGVVFSTPSHNALKLSRISEGRVLAFFSPYVTGHSRNTWFWDQAVLPLARQGLQAGLYQGIGEVHVISGLGPRRDNAVLQGLLRLAAEFDVPFTIHTEASSYRFLSPLCQQHPKVRFLWAHAGGILGPEHARGIIEECPNVWVELSARDPAHYGGLVDDDGRLRGEWRQLLVAYPHKFMLGTDPVWNAHQVNRWYEADEGWSHYAEILDFHRRWLTELPEAVADGIRLNNALAFFGRPVE